MRELIKGSVLIVLCAAWPAFGQSYPGKPIRLIVPAAPGGGPDVTARYLAPKFAKALGQPIVVENRAGANAAIGADIVANAPADGNTWLLATGQHTANPSLQPNLSHDIVKDFAPVSLLVANTYFLVVHPSLPARSVRELVALARARPGKLNFGSGGVGSASHLSGELFKAEAKVDMVHVSYKGASLAVSDLLGGHLELMFPAIPSALPFTRSGRLRGLAVTSAQRHAALPDVPTIGESGLPGFDFRSWVGVLVPAATPREAVRRFHAVIVETVNQRENREALIALGTEPLTSSSPEEFATYIREQVARFSQLLKAVRVKAD
jgi:tripartite-type tricarboxylate transporter receptor subunit TctC